MEALLSRRRLAEEKLLGIQRRSSRKGSLLHCGDSAVTNSPHATVLSRDWARGYVVPPDSSRTSKDTKRGPTRCVAPEGESNQEILGIAVRQIRQIVSG